MARGTRGRPARGAQPMGDLAIFTGLIVLAWVHRLFFLFSNLDANWPFTIFYEGDSETFYDYARAILNGTVYDGGIPFHPPAFPYFLSIIHTLIGAGPGEERVPYVPLKVCMALIGSLPVGLGYLLARPYVGRAVALTGAMLSAYSFALYVMAIAPVSESLYATLLLCILLVWTRRFHHPLTAPEPWGPTHQLVFDPADQSSNARLRGLSSRDLMWGALLGVLLGLLCLTRAEGMLMAVSILGIGACSTIFVSSAGSRLSSLGTQRLNQDPHTSSSDSSDSNRGTGLWRRLRPWIVTTAAMILVIAPWTIRNAIRLHEVNVALSGQLARPLPEFVPITAYGPLNFALANNELAKGTFSRDILTSQAQSATLDIRDPQHLEFFLDGYEIGWRFIREHPGQFVKLVLARWGLFFDSLRLGWTQWNLPGGLVGVRRPVDLFVPESSAGLWSNAFLMLGGLAILLRPVLSRRNEASPRSSIASSSVATRRWLFIVVLVTGCGMVTTGLFYGYARLGVLLLPIWFTLMATLLVAVASWVTGKIRSGATKRSSLSGRTIAIGIVALLFLVEAWGAAGDRNYHATGTHAEGAGHLNPHDTMHLEVISKTD